MKNIKLLNLVVVIVGAAIIFLGLNVGLGGIKTLGWQTTRDFISITDAATFHAQDSHIRFIGGIWFGVGATFLIGGFAMHTFRPTLIILSAMIAIAGLFRISDIDSGIIFSASIAPSLVLELFGFPLLACWLVMSRNRESKADG
jgi:hypothetical protein